jgi:hypothetical protein
MPKSYKDFLNEASKWYSSHNEFEEEEIRNSYNSYEEYRDYDNDMGADYDEPEEYNYYVNDDEEFHYNEVGYIPNKIFNKDDVIIYDGNTGGRRGQKGKVHRIREDGKVVMRFDIDDKLIAVNKDRVFHEVDNIEIKKLEQEWKIKKDKEREERLANQKQNIIEPHDPNEKWWEKNKKEK